MIRFGLIAAVIGVVLFLWDVLGDAIHFVAFIPFFILGPIMVLAGIGMFIAGINSR